MSGLEVIGGISAVISILDASKRIFDNVQKDMNLPKTFQVVGRRLPVIKHTLEICISNLRPNADSISETVCDDLGDLIYVCQTQAKCLDEIFQKVIPGPDDTFRKRYSTALRRLGKGKEVEELMKLITKSVQDVVNHQAVMSVDQSQTVNLDLKEVIQELDSLQSSSQTISNSEGAQTTYNLSGGGSHRIYTHTGSGDLIEHQHNVIVSPENFGFQEPVGDCLGKAPSTVPEFFIGRGSELDAMKKYFQETRDQSCLVLYGIGGIGKTQLAITYARRNSHCYRSMFWLNAENEATLNSSFQDLAVTIFNDASDWDSKETIQHVHHWLCDNGNTSWLVIFDNYDSNDDDKFNINDYIPLAYHGAIIITTRQPGIVTRSNHRLKVEAFQNIEDSLAILQTRSGRAKVQSDPFARTLADRLAGLPIALATAGAYLRTVPFTFEKYLQEYENRWNLNPTSPHNVEGYISRTFYTTWNISYDNLKSDEAEILRLLAYFSNQGLRYELFYDGLTETSPFHLRELITDDVFFHNIMRVLTESSFLEIDIESASWSMHRCIHDWTLAVLNSDINLQYYWFAFGCVDAVVRGFDAQFLGRTTFSSSASHATQLVKVLKKITKKDISLKFSSDQLQKISRAAILLREQVQISAAEEMYIQAKAECEKTLGPGNTLTLDICNNFGLLYRDQGKLDKAEQMYLRARDGYVKTLGLNDSSTINSIINLGALYFEQGKLEKSERLYLEAQVGYLQSPAPSHTSVAHIAKDLGSLGLYHSSVHDSKAFGSSSDYQTKLNDLANNLGNSYRAQGKLNEAEKMLLQARAGYEKAVGVDHTSTFDIAKFNNPRARKADHLPIYRVKNNLGELYRDKGMFTQSEQMYLQARAGYLEMLGPNHVLTLDVINNLGALYEAEGKLDAAEKMYTQALAGKNTLLGPAHVSTLNTISNFGQLYLAQGKLDEAERKFNQAIAGYKLHFGPDTQNASILTTVNSLGSLYLAQGKLGEADDMYRHALAGRERLLGMDHHLTLDTVNNVGNLYRAQGKLDESEKMYDRALAGYEKAFAPSKHHTSIIRTLYNLALLYRDQGKLDKVKLEKAEQMFIRAMAAWYEELGPEHNFTLQATKQLGDVYLMQKRWDEAKTSFLQAQAGYEKIHGSEHTLTLTVTRRLGTAYIGLNQLQKAEEMYERVLFGYDKIRGSNTNSESEAESNKIIFDIVKALEAIYSAQGKSDDAERMRCRLRTHVH